MIDELIDHVHSGFYRGQRVCRVVVLDVRLVDNWWLCSHLRLVVKTNIGFVDDLNNFWLLILIIFLLDSSRGLLAAGLCAFCVCRVFED